MIVLPIKIARGYVIDLERREDHRGFFARSWCQEEFRAHGLNPRVAQVNVGFSRKKGTLRGLHYQLPPYEEARLVRCTMGAIYDVIVDLRPDSSTHKQWVGVELTAENRRMLHIPEGCAHGYETLVDNTEMYYQTSQFYAPEYVRGIRHDDPTFGIEWPLPVDVISDADRSWPDYER